MKTIKKFLGLIWIILGPIAMVFMFLQAVEKVGLTHTDIERTNTMLQWGIILFIFLPISIGLMVFGFYAWKGEYDNLPETSEEI
ncbi:hypothetical protein EZJ43_00440 [Pedobacter changchengzhani]|uniref:Uncharacterized protein n=1 Tax=Pedobacter changchengzhani TaxID=2529274 RepID=A0A4R5MQQ3_9SPHI|nr:hypothetical protein [Pedobacter changchengzhani]TDG37599.1 hypothetical protein EZJ43_00440 [Pedobacter changchengzhani]